MKYEKNSEPIQESAAKNIENEQQALLGTELFLIRAEFRSFEG